MEIRSVTRLVWKTVVFLACSVFLLGAVTLTLAFGFDLSKSETASWVQAIGAIVSIWVAWWISSVQVRRSARLERQKTLAKCEAIIELLKNLKSVIKPDLFEDDGTRVKETKSGLERVSLIMDGIDILSLPHPTFVDSICTVRKEIERLMVKLTGAPYAMLVINSGIPDASEILKRIDTHITACESETKRL